MAHGHRPGISRHHVILYPIPWRSGFSDICGGIRGGQRRSPLVWSIGLVIYGSVLPTNLAWRSILLATVYQKIIVFLYCSTAFFRRGPLQWIETTLVIK